MFQQTIESKTIEVPFFGFIHFSYTIAADSYAPLPISLPFPLFGIEAFSNLIMNGKFYIVHPIDNSWSRKDETLVIDPVTLTLEVDMSFDSSCKVKNEATHTVKFFKRV